MKSVTKNSNGIEIETLLSLNEHDDILFDSPKSIEQKVKYVREQGLMGIVFWEIGQDYYGHQDFEGGMLIQSTSTLIKTLKETPEEKKDEL